MIAEALPAAVDPGAIRAEVAAALSAAVPAGTSVALGPVRSIHLPALVVSPGVPYIRPGDAWCTKVVSLLVYALVGAEVTDPCDALEDMVAIAEPAIGTVHNATYDGVTELGALIDGPGGVSCRMATIELNVKR